MKQPAAMIFPPIECMPFANYYPVVVELEAELEPATPASEAQPAGDGHTALGFWEQVLEAFAAMAWPYGYTGM